MKLMTSIPARKDGIVVASHDDKQYVFRADESGDLVAEVDDAGALALFLGTGNFLPYDESDMPAAVALLNVNEDEGEEAGPSDDEDDGDGHRPAFIKRGKAEEDDEQ